MSDKFDQNQPGLESPIEDGASIAPDDVDDLDDVTRAIWVGTGGNVKVDLKGSGTVTLNNVADGTMLPLRVTKVHATDTTASNMVALW